MHSNCIKIKPVLGPYAYISPFKIYYTYPKYIVTSFWHSPIDSSYKSLHGSQRKMHSQYVDVPPVLCLPDSYWCQTRNQNPAQKEKTKRHS